MEKQAALNGLKKRKNLFDSKKIDIPYDDLFEMYILDCRLRGIEELTIKGYRYALKYFTNFVGKKLMCSDITQDLINSYVLYLKDKYKVQTVNSYQFKISPVIHFGVDKGYIKEQIEFSHVAGQESVKEIYTEEELKKILERPKDPTFAQYRNWIICTFLLATGIRSKELRELLIRDLDLPNGVVKLAHTKNKKVRYVPLPTSLTGLLIEYLSIRKGAKDETLFCNQFGEPIRRTTLQNAVAKHCSRVGVDKHSVHLFRHTFITLSIRKGVSPIILRRITGHQTFRMLDHYYQNNITDLVNIVDEFNPLEDFKRKAKPIQM